MQARRESNIGAVILAAGMSSRMGEAKQLLRLGASTLLEQVIDNVRSAGVDDLIVVLGHEANKVVESIARKNLRTVVNDAYREGMGTSLRTGISALTPDIDAVLVVLADQPFVRPETLKRIVDQYRKSTAQIVIPMYKGFRGNPVLLDRTVFPEVMALSGDVGCRAIFGSHTEGIVKVPVEDVGILLDLDSKEDLERLKNFGNVGPDEKTLLRPADLQGREIPGLQDSSADKELVVVGREPVGITIAKIAKLMNFTVTVVDPLLTMSEVPEADRVLNSLSFWELPTSRSRYVVVASRGRFDEEAVEQALRVNSAYVALVANKKRAQEIRLRLQSRGESAESLAKVHAPAGLDIGAETPAEIALSIMAEIVAESRNKAASSSAATAHR
jgi:molybdenum cofactor cytidylyltransferase